MAALRRLLSGVFCHGIVIEVSAAGGAEWFAVSRRCLVCGVLQNADKYAEQE